MFKNYFVVAVRNILQHKLYSSINIVGLAVALTAAILIMLLVRDELSYDTFWQDHEQIYRLQTTVHTPGKEASIRALSSGPAAKTLKNIFTEQIESSSRIQWMYPSVRYQNKLFSEVIYRADPEFSDIFSIPVISGNIKQALADNSSIAIDESFAIKLFGQQPALNKVISLNFMGKQRDFRIAAVFKDLPSNTIMNFRALIKLDDNDTPGMLDAWENMYVYTYFKLAKDASISHINSRLNNFVETQVALPESFLKLRKTSDAMTLDTIALQDIQHYSPAKFEMKQTGDITTVIALSAVAGLILLIASFNFINLTLTKSTQRAREITLRKIMGAKRSQLITQFLGESLLLSLCGLLLSLLLTELVLPLFNDLLARNLIVDYFDLLTVISLISLVFFIGIMAGIYPALVLSALSPSKTLKATKSAESKNSVLLRNVLVMLQFTISASLIVSTVIVYWQTQYVTTQNFGFNNSNMLILDNIGQEKAKAKAKQQIFREQLIRLPNVVNAAYSDQHPASDMGANLVNVTLPNNPSAGLISIGSLSVGLGFFETYSIELINGRSFSKDYALDRMSITTKETLVDSLTSEVSTADGSVIINQKAVISFGFSNSEHALNKLVKVNNQTLKIIGVIPDIAFKSRRKIVEAELYRLSNAVHVMSVQYQGDPITAVADIKKIWQQFLPTIPFAYQFADQIMTQQFRQEQTIANMLGYFALLAIIIACLGLIGLASYTVDRKTKEIGIRKVLGAKAFDIIRLLVWQFSKPVLLANLIAWPLSSILVLNWLSSFAYRLDSWVLIPVFIVTGLITLSIAWVTVAGNVYRVAKNNPIKALNYE